MRVVIVFDRDYGAGEDADLGDAFWLIESPVNRALAQPAWVAGAADANSAVFDPVPGFALDDQVLDRLEDADLHHPGWTEMVFIGVALGPALRQQLVQHGLRIDPIQGGFVVRR